MPIVDLGELLLLVAVAANETAVAAAIALAAAELRGEGPTEGILLGTLTVRLVSSVSYDKQTHKQHMHYTTHEHN